MKYHNSIDKLPLSIFIDCLCDADYQSLVIEGEVEPYILQDAWMNIQEQYTTLMGNSEHRMYLKLLKEVNLAVAVLNQINSLIETMRNYYTTPFGKHMNRLLKSNIVFTPLDWTAYQKQIDGCVSKTKGMEMHLEINTVSLEAMSIKMNAKGGEKPTRDYFAKVLNAIEEHYSIQVSETILVNRFCDRVRRMSKTKEKINGRPGR